MTRRFALAAVLSLSIPTAAMAEAPELGETVTISKDDLLDLYSMVTTNRMLIKLGQDAKMGKLFDSIEVVLADANGRMHLNLTLREAAVTEIQKRSAAEQMRFLAQMRIKFAEQLIAGLQGQSSSSAFSGIKRNQSAADLGLITYFESRTTDDVQLNVAFTQDGKAHLYATATHDGTKFNPNAPTAR